MRRAAIATALAALAVAGPAAAQSKGELSWALTTCLRNVTDLRQAQKAFVAKGYSYEPEDFGGGPDDVLHWYYPADKTVQVAIAIGKGGKYSACRISPRGVTVGQAVPYARAAAAQLLGVPFVEGTPRGGGNPACDAWAKIRGFTVQVDGGSVGQDPMCLAAEPAQIMISVTKG